MWDERYSDSEYAYGTQPNDFLRANVAAIPKGKVLSLAEGEGRNAVFLAQQGYEVTAVDASAVGIKKAQSLAEQNAVKVNFIQADLTEFDPGVAQWDGLVSIFFPLGSRDRKALHKRMINALKPAGVFLLEAYTPAQVHNQTGGGKEPDNLQTAQSVQTEWQGLHFTHLQELERDVVEGRYHTGLANVVQAIAKKRGICVKTKTRPDLAAFLTLR